MLCSANISPYKLSVTVILQRKRRDTLRQPREKSSVIAQDNSIVKPKRAELSCVTVKTAVRAFRRLTCKSTGRPRLRDIVKKTHIISRYIGEVTVSTTKRFITTPKQYVVCTCLIDLSRFKFRIRYKNTRGFTTEILFAYDVVA